ncbi:hypothetical protein H5410_018398 [Solanum commersonii]|uniref:Uncharacterized protein n=1 Tax=Solanum commersonii TaxID=4109 RepID=A0A9J6A1U5_SOLCO|nr:hypothetical protein H5410_018398 [Solanum commersonii]
MDESRNYIVAFYMMRTVCHELIFNCVNGTQLPYDSCTCGEVHPIVPLTVPPVSCLAMALTCIQLIWCTHTCWITSMCALGFGYGHIYVMPGPKHRCRVHGPIFKLISRLVHPHLASHFA